ncbi:hypothetical protein DESC_30019 [Desulfosarcina cetonica]|nr:hypothetical protein DESC_30019 [Desulfosarcina cetonica]
MKRKADKMIFSGLIDSNPIPICGN